MAAAILTLVLIGNTPADMPTADARITVIRADRVRNVHGGTVSLAIRVTIEMRGELSYYWWDVPGRRWYWSAADRGKVSHTITRDKVPQKVRHLVLSLMEE